MSRRSFLQWSAIVAGSTLAKMATDSSAYATEQAEETPNSRLEETAIADLQKAMASGQLTSRELVRIYLERIDAIDKHGPTIRSILQINPDALKITEALDAERKTKGLRGPLHGIPILLKDNIDTADKMDTTAKSVDQPPMHGSRSPVTLIFNR